jgi:hypothetical protein
LGNSRCWSNRGWWKGTSCRVCWNRGLVRDWWLWLVISCLHRGDCRLNWELRDHNDKVCFYNAADFEGLV